MTKLLRSTSVRLALIYALLLVVSSLTLVGLLWWHTVGYLDREINAVIAADTRAIGDRLHDFGLPGAMQTVEERVDANQDKRSEEHTSELQSLMRNSYAVFCLKKKK